jgi:lipid-binding SYLF domain-containing protein
MEGGSVGFQIGATSTDVVALVMSERGMQRLMTDKFTIGADAAAAAGPVGRQVGAETDVELHAEILSWSRARGAFAGVSLKGVVVTHDQKANAELYGHPMSNHEVLSSTMRPPAAARPLIAELDRYSVKATPAGAAARERTNPPNH